MIFTLSTAPASLPQQLHHSSVEKPTGTALPIRGTASLNGSVTAESIQNGPSMCVADEAVGSTSRQVKGHGEIKQDLQAVPGQEGEAKMEPKENGRVAEVAKEIKKRLITDDSANLEIKSDDSPPERQEQASDPTKDNTERSTFPAESRKDDETTKHKQAKTKSQLRRHSEGQDEQQKKTVTSSSDAEDSVEVAQVHPEPEAKTKPTVGFTEPQIISRPVSESITPAVSPDESQDQSLRPRTLSFISEKYGGLLGQGYRPGSTSSSSDLLESPLFAARRRLLNQSKVNAYT